MVEEAVTVERLYDCAQTLSSVKGDFSLHEDEFRTILAGVKGNTQAKRLASQFTARFFFKFPQLGNEALDSILDLCEDDDVNIRKQAIKDLPHLCRENKAFMPKIADVLTQLLQTDDSSELVVIQNSLMSLFRKDARSTLVGLFSQIKAGDNDLVRERAIKFLHVKIKMEGGELLNRDAEAHLLREINTCLKKDDCCTSEEFHTFMAILGATSLPKTINGQSLIVEMVSSMIDFEKPFNADDEEAVDRVIQSFKAVTPFFSAQVKSTKYCEYLCLSVLPVWDSLTSIDQGQILKLLAEFCMFTAEIKNPLIAIRNVYQRLMEYLPQPPQSDGEAAKEAAKFEFTKVECILYTFHTLGRQAPNFLADNADDILKKFKARLQYYALLIQGYIRKLREFLDDVKKAKQVSSSDEVKLKETALHSATNINALIKDLFRSPPSYKTKIVVSWRSAGSGEKGSNVKRKSITFDDNMTTKKKTALSEPLKRTIKGSFGGVYTPPQGKYSGGSMEMSSANNGSNRYSNRGGGRKQRPKW